MAVFGTDNAIAWGQFRVNGGWTRTLISAGGILIVLGGLILFSVSIAYRATSTLDAWAHGLLSVQMGILLLFGAARISTSIGSDIRSKMIESHRLMPISTTEAITGYLIGPTLGPLVLWLTIALVGIACGLSAGFNLTALIGASAVVLIFSLFLWSIVLFGAFLSRAFFLLYIIGAIIISLPTGGAVSAVLPGLAILDSPLVGHTIYEHHLHIDTLVYPLGACFVAQVCIALILLTAAGRRYESSNAPVLGPMLNLLLLLAFMTFSALGMVKSDDFQSNFAQETDVPASAQLVCTLAAGMILAATAITSAGYATLHWQQARALGVPKPRVRRFNIFLMAALAMLMLFGFHLLMAHAHPNGLHRSYYSGASSNYTVTIDVLKIRRAATIRIGLTLLIFLWTITAVVRLGMRGGRGLALLVAIWIALSWIVPELIDVVTSPGDQQHHVPIWQMSSPIGMLAYLVNPSSLKPNDMTGTQLGLIVQAGLAVWLELILLLLRVRFGKSNLASAPTQIQTP